MIIDAHAHIFSHACPRVSPPEFADGRFPVERLLALMDAEGVDGAVIVQNPVIGTINEEVREALDAYPERFAGVVQVDPVAPGALEVIREYVRSRRQRTVKLEMSEEWGWSGVHPGLRLDGPELMGLWGLADEMGINVIIDPGAIGKSGYQVEAIDRLSETHAGVRFLIEHLGYMQSTDVSNEAARRRRIEMLRLALKPNVSIGFAATATLLEESYPCYGAVGLLKEAVELVGANKILWGTDVPYTLRRHTYKQMLDTVRGDAPFLSDAERRCILGENAREMFFNG
jgi:predicted TIM-barrel fold metal-dependent hydrolase